MIYALCMAHPLTSERNGKIHEMETRDQLVDGKGGHRAEGEDLRDELYLLQLSGAKTKRLESKPCGECQDRGKSEQD
jgi:hypothetical protein